MNWNRFDKIYCISLDERRDRQQEAKEQFERVGLANRVEFVIVKKHPTDCEQGIYESHMLCLEKGIEADADNILIFEDDIVFDRIFDNVLQDCIDFMFSGSRWHILFFGCMVKKSCKTKNSSVVKIKYQALAHAYVVNKEFAKTLVKIFWQKKPYDDMLRDLTDDHMYAACPSFALQSDSASDNEKCMHLDRFRRLCGGFRRVQRLNEFYYRNQEVIIAAHIVVIFLIIMMAVC